MECKFIKQTAHDKHSVPYLFRICSAVCFEEALPHIGRKPSVHIFCGFSHAYGKVGIKPYLPRKYLHKLRTDCIGQHIMNIRQLIAPQPLCNIVQAPPELIAGSRKLRLRRLFHTILLVCRLGNIGHNAVLPCQEVSCKACRFHNQNGPQARHEGQACFRRQTE